MDNRGMIRALGHSHRHKILQTLEKEPMAYSNLLAKVEPESKGRGRFNYHLKVLKDAGLIDIAGAQYRLTPSGAVAAQLLIQASKKVVPPPRRRTQLTIIGSLIGVGGIGLLLLLSMVLAPVVFEAPGTARDLGWKIPTFVSEQDREAASPQVAVDPNGNAIVIWTQDDGHLTNVWANRFVTGVGWGAPTLIENNDTGDAFEPMLAIDPSGNAWAVWDQIVRQACGCERHSVWANRFVPEAGWGEATLIAGGESEAGDIGLDASGALTIVWNEWRGGHGYAIYAARFVPDIGWMSATALRDDVPFPYVDRNPSVQLAVDAEGRAIALWWDAVGTYASRYVPNEEWGPAILVGPGRDVNSRGAYPSIAMDSDGNAIAVWFSEFGHGGSDEVAIYAARFVPGFGWGKAVPIVRDVASSGKYSQLAVDAEGNAILAWSKQRPNEPVWVDLFVMHFDPGVGWGDPIRIAEKVGTAGLGGDSGDFALAMEPAGIAAILYDDNNSGIFAIRYLAGVGWSVPSLIGTGGAQCAECPPAVAVDPAGNVIAVWEDRKSAPFGVLASRFVATTSLEQLARDMRDQRDRNQMALDNQEARMATLTGWLAVSLGLLVATIVLTGVLLVLRWKPRPGLAEHREIPDDSGRPPGPGG